MLAGFLLWLGLAAGSTATPQQTLAFINAQFINVPASDTTDAIEQEHIELSADHQTLVFEAMQKLKVCCKDRGTVTYRWSAPVVALHDAWAGNNYIRVDCAGGKACATGVDLYSDGHSTPEAPQTFLTLGNFPTDPSLMTEVCDAVSALLRQVGQQVDVAGGHVAAAQEKH